jgi:antitoxin (DNA-binding transcriptional repressor) of toxin-antitoxin stability system
MKMGVKEFRERFSALAEGEEPVLVTKNGRIVGRYMPERPQRSAPEELRRWVGLLERSRDEWRAATPDWRERSLAAGIPEDELDT